SFLSMAYFGLWMPLIFLATLALGLYACAAAGILVPEPHPNPLALAWLILLPAGAALCLLLKDLCALLQWIIRHPAAEKPRLAFLPGSDNPSAAGWRMIHCSKARSE